MPLRGKRKSSALTSNVTPHISPPELNGIAQPAPKRRATGRKSNGVATNPDVNEAVLDGKDALRASPDAGVEAAAPILESKPTKKGAQKKSYARPKHNEASEEAKQKATADPTDPEADGLEDAPEEELKEALARPPPVHSDCLPLPWKGRLGYACLCTYLRSANPPVFSSRTCRIQSILDHRHPLTDPNAPEHPTKNRPDKTKPLDIACGQKYVEELGLANARDIVKMIRWNDRYGIKFMRLSSEMFPFASHEEYGYKLAPFAAETLAEAGRVAAKLGHRLTTHPGQYTQLGSPRKSVIDNSLRDLAYHAEMLDLLKLPPQQDRDAVMILHLGGVFGDKGDTLDRFRANYAGLATNIKKRLVLENDDVSWSIHDLLPVCEELNIPFVLDFHHHNIIFDKDQIREGTKDIIEFFPRILKTWERKGITPKMHYSEPTAPAITPRQRRKHSARVATLPPCPPTMDLMIEAKDKEQAVFELMRAFKLPGFDRFNDVVPHIRTDEFRAARPYTKKELKDRTKAEERGEQLEIREDYLVAEEDVGMGGPEGRVYWPPGMEEWLRPVKRVVAKKEGDEETPKKKKKKPKVKQETEVNGNEEMPPPKQKKAKIKPKPEVDADKRDTPKTNGVAMGPQKKMRVTASLSTSKTAPEVEESDDSEVDADMDYEEAAESVSPVVKPTRNARAKKPAMPARPSRRASARVSYAEVDGD